MKEPLISLNHYSSFTRLKWTTAWVLHFVRNCCPKKFEGKSLNPLSTIELKEAECYWIGIIKNMYFHNEILALERQSPLPSSSSLKTLQPFPDSKGLLQVGGRLEMSQSISYEAQHPLILRGVARGGQGGHLPPFFPKMCCTIMHNVLKSWQIYMTSYFYSERFVLHVDNNNFGPQLAIKLIF